MLCVVKGAGAPDDPVRVAGWNSAPTVPTARRNGNPLPLSIDLFAARPKPLPNLFAVSYRLRLPKSDTLSTAVILDELNSSDFKSPANGRFIRECNWYFPVNDLGPSDRSNPYL
jgi:hypothetical protein